MIEGLCDCMCGCTAVCLYGSMFVRVYVSMCNLVCLNDCMIVYSCVCLFASLYAYMCVWL